MTENRDTIVAIATPLGKGGIGVIRVSGKKSKKICLALTGHVPLPRQAQYVTFSTSSKQVLDKGIVLFFEKPASYTGEDIIECHVHGNRILLEMLVDEIISLGARLARPGEFTERAFLNDKMDLIQAEAVADLIDSHSKKAVRSARQSLDGVFSKDIMRLKEQVFNARALVEAVLDFPDDDDVELNIEPAIENIEKCLSELELILKKAEAGRVLDHDPIVVIAGLPNAGKSCLINFLCGYDSAIVSAEAGTTRDIIREKVLLKGFVVTLIDTAGLREPGNEIEKEGINKAYKALASADMVLYVVDNSLQQETKEDVLGNHISSNTHKIRVKNKIDICKNTDYRNTEDEVYVSAKTGMGIDDLVDKICSALAMMDNNEDIIFARQRHIDALNSVKVYLQQILIAAEQAAGLEVLAESMRLALSGFDEVTGKTSSDDVLGKVFSLFCIGK